MKNMKDRRAQVTMEYIIVFTLVVAAILLATGNYIKPAITRMFQRAAGVIDAATSRVQ